MQTCNVHSRTPNCSRVPKTYVFLFNNDTKRCLRSARADAKPVCKIKSHTECRELTDGQISFLTLQQITCRAKFLPRWFQVLLKTFNGSSVGLLCPQWSLLTNPGDDELIKKNLNLSF